MNYKLSALLIVCCLLLLSRSSLFAQAQPNPWVEITLLDLQGVHDILRDNHPGPVDPENSRYGKWLEEGLQQAQERARAVYTYSDYVRVLRFYTNAFQDGHLGVGIDVLSRYVTWPGFLIGPDENGSPRVVYADSDSGVKLGDTISQCDGRSIDDLMKERVDPYYWNSAIPHERPLRLHYLFHLDPNDAAYRLKTCRFSAGEIDLTWKRMDRTEFEKLLNDSLGTSDRELAIRQVGGVWFVRVPTLAFPTDAGVRKIREFLASLAAKAPELRQSLVVFDVRGNGGGSSSWGEEIASVLWSREWVNYIEAGFDGTVDWRVSPMNLRWAERMEEREARAGLKNSANYWRHVADTMNRARSEGKQLARVADVPSSHRRPRDNPVTGKIYFLTDGRCASACLDFADLMRRLPGVTHVGLPTSADAIYIDNTTADLPSGLGVLGYSLKVYRHRVRANNEWYEPQVRWPGGAMTDESVAKWIASLARN